MWVNRHSGSEETGNWTLYCNSTENFCSCICDDFNGLIKHSLILSSAEASAVGEKIYDPSSGLSDCPRRDCTPCEIAGLQLALHLNAQVLVVAQSVFAHLRFVQQQHPFLDLQELFYICTGTGYISSGLLCYALVETALEHNLENSTSAKC